jgi:hypothetical protein
MLAVFPAARIPEHAFSSPERHGGPMPESPFTPYQPPSNDSLHAHIPPGSPQGVPSFARTYGLHPLTALGMFAVDQMLFGLEGVSLGVLAVFSVIVGLALTLPCALIQRYAYNDDWGAAWGKGLLVGIMTAIPTSLPSVLTAGWGVLGLVGMIGGGRRPPPGPDAVHSDVIDMQN